MVFFSFFFFLLLLVFFFFFSCEESEKSIRRVSKLLREKERERERERAWFESFRFMKMEENRVLWNFYVSFPYWNNN